MARKGKRPGEAMLQITLNVQIMQRVNLASEMTLEDYQGFIARELELIRRGGVAVAIAAACAKRRFFSGYGDHPAFENWMATHFNIGKRQGYRYINAGRCLMEHPDLFSTLSHGNIKALSEMAKLPADAMRAFLSRYPKALQMEEDEARAKVTAFLDPLHRELPPPAAEPKKFHQPELPGLEALETFDAKTLDPITEGEYMGVFLQRTREAFRSQLDSLTDKQLKLLHETIDEMDAEMQAWRQILAARLPACHTPD